MRTCVIFNPAAKGDKARQFCAHLDRLAAHAVFKKTTAPQDARRLAAEAVAEGFEIVVAAGGDGTVNEVLNGIGDADGFERARLGVLPLGTVNVFARELNVPLSGNAAWEVIHRARETRIDLPHAEFSDGGKRERRYFAQLAGAGLDARAIELVEWSHKKRVGPLAYVVAGWRAAREPQPKITVRSSAFRRQDADHQTDRLKAELQTNALTGELVLVGNGKFYGGQFKVFPEADLCDGLLEVCVFPCVNWITFTRHALVLLLRRRLPAGIQRIQTPSFNLTAEPSAAFEVDGEWAGRLPVTFGVERKRLRVIVP